MREIAALRGLGEEFVIPALASSDSKGLQELWARDAARFGFEGYDFGLIAAEAERSLFTIFAQEVLRFDELRTMLQQVLRCVKHLHDRGVVHADIKPLNVRSVSPCDRFILTRCRLAADHARRRRQL